VQLSVDARRFSFAHHWRRRVEVLGTDPLSIR
jgi:hypothetical protein